MEGQGRRYRRVFQTVPGRVGARSLALFHRFGPDAVIPIMVLCTVAAGIDAGNRGLHALVDNYSLLCLQSHLLCQLYVGADACGHNHHPGFHHFPCFQADTAHMAVPLDGFHIDAGADHHPGFGCYYLQLLPGALIHLTSHQGWSHFKHRHLNACLLKLPCCFQSQNTASDDHGLLRGLHQSLHPSDIRKPSDCRHLR